MRKFPRGEGHAPLWFSCCLHGFPMSFLRRLKRCIGMFQCLSGMLVSGLMIFFSVVHGGSTVRVRGEFVEFGGSLVRVIWHVFPILCAYLRVISFF
jgi:hypothetical protein